MLDPPDQAPPDGETEDDQAAPAQPKPKSGSGGTMLAAAMLAIGDILEPDKTTVEIVQTNDDPIDDLPFDIDFGHLPPLD